MTALLARLIDALARLADPTVCRFANDTDDAPPWDDYGYHHDQEQP